MGQRDIRFTVHQFLGLTLHIHSGAATITKGINMFRRIIWGDVETTGLDPADGDSLLEVAFLVTDFDLNILESEGYQATLAYTESEVARLKEHATPYVQEMHTKTGLWDKLVSGTEADVVDSELLEYLTGLVPEARSARLAGNSITLDRNFLKANLPDSYAHIHYRSFDVSTLTGLAEEWLGVEPFKKKLNHSAMDDIRESIEELKYLREHAFGITGF